MQFVSFEKADPLLSWTKITDALQNGHAMSAAKIGDTLLTANGNALLTRSAYIEGLGLAVKSMSVFPGNAKRQPALPTIQGGVMLFSHETGTLEAVLDGILVTKWKTAADSALGARLLARQDSRTHLIIGAGTVARSILHAYRAEFPSIETFQVWNRTIERAEELATKARDMGIPVKAVENLADAATKADIITTATMSTQPILKGEWVKPGTHVDLIGAYRPDMREADDDLITKADLYCDSFSTNFGHIGEYDIPIERGIITKSDVISDLYGLCAQTYKRRSDDAITVFKNGGGAHMDLMTARAIFSALS